MNLTEDYAKIIQPCSSIYKYSKNPYYIYITRYDQNSSGLRLMHQLCSLLNQNGFEAYIVSSSANGQLWTPILTEQIKLAHFQAGKKPIVVYPETVSDVPMVLGIPVRYVLWYPGVHGGEKVFKNGEVIFQYRSGLYGDVEILQLPIVDMQLFSYPEQGTDRNLTLVYFRRYLGLRKDHGEGVIEISLEKSKSLEETAELYKQAKVLYIYEWSIAALEARLCGCPVVFIPNEQCLLNKPVDYDLYSDFGFSWGDDQEGIEYACNTVKLFQRKYLEVMAAWQTQFSNFISLTQAKASTTSMESAWPQSALDTLKGVYTKSKDLADRADRLKWARLNHQHIKWSKYCTLREIDAQIYAEMVMTGDLPPLSIVIDQRFASAVDLADTLDSVMACLGQPEEVIILSLENAPSNLVQNQNLRWVCTEVDSLSSEIIRSIHSDWVLLIEAGNQLTPQALIEWAWAASVNSEAGLIYADEDIQLLDGKFGYPHFKPDANIELLRCTNYIGNAVLVKLTEWRKADYPLFDGQLYTYALQLLNKYGKVALGHVDSILFHSTKGISTARENNEFQAVKKILDSNHAVSAVRPRDRLGTWLVEYQSHRAMTVSLVISTGMQTGYLRCFLESVQRYIDPSLVEILLVCSPAEAEEVSFVLADLSCNLVRIILLEQQRYNHAASLNAGVEQAVGELILIADDDTEPLEANWLSKLMGVMVQQDVGCVAPRLVASDGDMQYIVGGPMVLGINGAAACYLGEEKRLEEVGVYSRLQLNQDVSAVAGHFFLTRKTDWKAVGGFDKDSFGLHHTVLDYCLKLSKLGKRHVWTPITSILHQGGKTLGALKQDVRKNIDLADREVTERTELLSKWAKELASDPNYNRHLSLVVPFDIEADIVIDWQPKRHDRPRVLATPLSSGAGQYRVIDPLDALQDAGIAQSCVVLPFANGGHRVLQALEILRAAPDRLILQHSVDDGQLHQIPNYKVASPNLKIIQMVDDLLGEVPFKHPNRRYQVREGHQRMMQALVQSDRLVVTTEPLADHYRRYVSDVRKVPNSLATPWLKLKRPLTPNPRLRVGWVGAGQHRGDLEMIKDVVQALSSEVDWIFMGMCPENMLSLLKEFHGGVNIAEYPSRVAELNLDIAVAPLEDNIFNNCKSNLRLLEYGAIGWPVVCSNVYPYREDNPPVVRVENTTEDWLEGIRKLIDNEEYRLQQANALHSWVISKYTIKSQLSKWQDAIFS